MTKITNTDLVTGIASEGQGIVRQKGLVTFIPFTATGDEVSYEIIKNKKNFAVGKLLNVVTPSSERAIPLCQYYGTCGGCQLQHIKYASQVKYKRLWIEEALRKIGKFQNVSVPAIIPANLQWDYRRRVSLVLRKREKGFQAGYITTDNITFLAVEHCPIFIKDHDNILKDVQKIVSQLKSSDSLDGKATLLKGNPGYIIHFHFRVMPENAYALLSENQKLFDGILASSQNKSFSLGSIDTSCEIEKLSFIFNPKTFIQNHPEQSLNIYRAITNIAETKQPKFVLDLYCGIGISTSLVARNGAKTIGIELNLQSIELAKANAKKNGLNNITYHAADVEKILPDFLSHNDFIIVNPPREGLAPKVAHMLKESPAKTILYISCMPPTLARDLKLICEGGYKIRFLQGFDMFPQTVHVETLVVLER
jgi:23S rRNA (uracil1939-C5)-methyltransferase